MILDLLKEKRLFCDGGMGSVLQKSGLKPGEKPEEWCLKYPEKIIEVHRAYLEAGADIITANTFGANCLKFSNYEEIIAAGILCAKKAVNGAKNKFVAFDMGPLGKMLEPMGELPFEEAVEIFAKSVRAADAQGADLILIETMNDCYETKAAVIAAKENSQLPVFVTNAYDETEKLLTGADPLAMVAMLEGLGADVIGANCSVGPDGLLPIAEKLCKYSSVPVMINPNAGLPQVKNGETYYDIDAERFSDLMTQMANLGVCILGGCCGTDPDYIMKTVEKCKNIPYAFPTEKDFSVISSYTHGVIIGEKPLLVGERINPTGKPLFKEALKNRDFNFILNEGIKQADKGVHILDVNVGLPGIDETFVMTETVKQIQSVCDLPLQIDSASPTVLEKAMRIYNGKPLINSVNGKPEVMNTVFPLVKKYGGTVIALTIDQNGIPKTAEERVECAENILKEAEKYGINKNDIVVDPLALTVSSDKNSASVTLKSLKLLKEKGIKTSLGISNISFGLPKREILNSVFFGKALEAGLDLAIINPFSSQMTDVYYAHNALSGLDNTFEDYIAYAQGTEDKKTVTPVENMTLKDAIIKGLSQTSSKEAKKLAENEDPLKIINDQIVPALEICGKAFEEKKIFLPQLLMCAEAASAAFAEVRKKIPSASKTGEKVILATVKGDIHDIGKNIVKVMLESYGFTVLDLGKDVDPEKVLKASLESECFLVGLSALMTTTLPAMEETVQLLHNAQKNIKVVVGGAVLNREYAESINADFYAKDAIETVRYAKKFYQNFNSCTFPLENS